MERNIAGGGGKGSAVVTAAVPLASLIPLIPPTVLLSFPDPFSGTLLWLSLGVYPFSFTSAIKLHFFLGIFLHFIIGAD
ncbi:MAG: hypothetical protein HFF17_12210 [Oscillospiraceae bacterium]|nr:hypothetical protein [Oscillospiraceae bacterium]